MIKKLIVGSLLVAVFSSVAAAREIALTFDDAPTPDSALMKGAERTEKLISALHAAKVPDVLFFVKADCLNPETQKRLELYAQAGFHIANHSYSHRSADQIANDDYLADVYRAHLLIKDLPNFLPYHRFPYLHAGKNLTSINYLRKELSSLGYKDGYVTVDNFDWYISALLNKAVDENKKIDYEKAREFYVKTLIANVEFYDAIAQRNLGRSPRHVLLLHENDAAALFVYDLIKELRKRGWKIISPQQAYKDKIAKLNIQTTFYKQGLVAALSADKGTSEVELRHPSENADYLDQEWVKMQVTTD